MHARAGEVLRKRRFRVDADPEAGTLSAERGYLREAGNLLFHVSVLVVLVGFALGQLFGYKGGVITIVGQGFTNSLSQYDDFAPGSMFSADDLAPLSFSVDDFHVKFLTSGPQMGQPESFDADLTYQASPDDPPRKANLAVNHPLQVDGTSVFLVGHGYAPVVTVRDGDGNVFDHVPVVFLPQDSSFRSFGVIKVPDARPEQLAFEGLFLPTYGFTAERGPFSQFPDELDPVLSLVPWHGDLGLDSGTPQSVYSLDKDNLKSYRSADPERLGPVRRIKLSVGADREAARRRRLHPVRRGRPLGQGAGQPQPRQGRRARRRARRDRRPDGLPVRAPAPRLGAGHPPGRAYRGRGRGARPQHRRRPDRRGRGAGRADPVRQRPDDDRQPRQPRQPRQH